MQVNNDKALREVELFFKKVEGALEKTSKAALSEMGEALVKQTPVYFEHEPTAGNARANWVVSAGNPDTTYDASAADITGIDTIRRLRDEIRAINIQDGSMVYISNTGPAGKLEALEFGKYPNPPKRGSYNKKTREFEIRSQGGYSLQAPAGIVGVTAMQWSDIVEEINLKQK